ncbi:copper chaperone PCu(A)C [Parvularcula dongshanensis]|uniref:Copper chaperone PCu(A)C n=1 Tax=Parvularcula dongshanensis TaxID=1173995 RepID=A0A840I532_9PROT|nr:copper chaperone PCu(A)C [Parvularcula dongshanensis]MBB4659130.1 hypothetical protein [Parvularcula dongshanensis]
MTLTYRIAKPMALCALLLAACGEAEVSSPAAAPLGSVGEAGAAIRVLDGRVRPMADGVSGTAGYLRITSDQDDAVISARSPLFKAVEVHEMKEADGVMRMRPVPRLPLPAGETVSLEPEGTHLMLIGADESLREGDSVPVTLTFESGQSLTLTLPVEEGR